MSNTIQDIQNEVIEEFGLLDGDFEMSINYVMELGEQMPEFEDADRTEDNIVKGCQSKVWLTASHENGKVVFKGDSNTAITKGLVSLLIRVLSEQKPEDILNEEIFFPSKIGMNRFIGTQRSNGFGAMIKQMKIYALAFSSTQKEVKS